MCGIAGFADAPDVMRPMSRERALELAHRMCDAIRHRGPDQEGLLVEPGIALAMRRLSIVDLATGNQPIHNETGSVSIVFNGEIYNFLELRAELEAAGHRFSTSTDTEAIVHAYEEWGRGAIGRLRGMFGLAIWDRRSRTLVLARDRVGIKPLHYALRNGRLYFGSEIKSLLEAPDMPRELNVGALDHYLSFLYTPRDESIFTHVRKLPPGHVLIWRDGDVEVEPYWRPPREESFRGSEEDAVEALDAILTEAVRMHLVADVPVGAFLSGGIDSSVVVALMARAHGRGVKTFSIGFREAAFDELAYARQVARAFGTDHHEFVVTPDAVEILDRLVWHFDEPFADASAIPTWYVAELARRHVTVVLSGDGGDELFGGYDRYLPHPRVAAFDRYVPAGLRPLAGVAASWWPREIRGRRFLGHVARDARGRYVDSVRFFGADEKASLLSPDVLKRERADPETTLARHFDRYAGLSWPSQMMRFDAETYLPGDILTKIDRMSMAHSIESRVPLLDNDVVQFAMSLPADLKIRNGRRKHVLKQVAARLLPGEVLERRKQGFGVPIGTWFRGNLRDLMADTLLSPHALQRGYLRPAFVRALVDEHLRGRRDHTMPLWQLVILERWLATYVDNAPGKSLPTSEPALPLPRAIGAR